MNEKLKKAAKTAAYAVGGIAVATAVGAAAFVCFNKPSVVQNPCWRSCHLADGRCKKAFDAAWKANLQSVKQFFLHGEICNPYQVGNKFYTGHSKYAICRSINLFKK